MTNQRDPTAQAYFAVVALLESTLISPERRRDFERLRHQLEAEMMAELKKLSDTATD